MATRFYLPSSGSPTPNISPAFSADWEDVSIGARLRMHTIKTNTVRTVVSY